MSIIGDHLTEDNSGMYEACRYYAVTGRLHGDDEDQLRIYYAGSLGSARQQFINDLRREDSIPEADIVAEYEYTNVYINTVVSSTAPIIEEN